MKGHKIILSAEQINEMKHRYVDKVESTRSIARSMGISFQSVAALLKVAGVKMDVKAHISAATVGKHSGPRPPRSLEWRHNLSEAMRRRTPPKGYKWSQEARERHRIVIKNRKPFTRADGESSVLPHGEAAARMRCRQAMKAMLRRVLRATGKRKEIPSEKHLGYSKHELRTHLERQFKPGMSWTNRNSFHIDHIVPIAVMLRQGITDPAIICALSNLQPLYPSENQKKSASCILA